MRHIAQDPVDGISELSGTAKTEQQRWLTYLSVGRRVRLDWGGGAGVRVSR